MGEDVAGIVLAAGRSRRMGRPKPLLEAGGESFVTRTVAALLEGGCAAVWVVAPGDPGDVAAVARRAGAEVAVNDDPGTEQLVSLRAGLAHLPDEAAAAAVLPVDHPLVRPETVTRLIDRWRAAPDRIVRPVHGGRPGHPTLFPRSTWSALRRDHDRGARSVVEGGRHPVEDVAVEDPGVVADIDTPEAYARLVGAS